MTKFIKLTNAGVSADILAAISRISHMHRIGNETYVYFGDKYYTVTETPEEIIAMIEAAESQPKPSDPIYPGFAAAANLELLLNEFREFKRLLSSELSKYNERLNKLERPNYYADEIDDSIKDLLERILRSKP